MSTPIFLCAPPTPPYTCRVYFTTRADTITHLATHTGFADFRRLHGTIGVHAIPVPATLHRAPFPAGLPVWVCAACTVYFTSNIAVVMHLQQEAHPEAAELQEQVGLAGFYEHVRTEYARVLVLHGAAAPRVQMEPAPVPLARRLAVNSPGARRMVIVPDGTTTRAGLGAVIGAAPPDWAHGLVVRYVTAGGEPQGAVLRTDQDVARFVAVMRLGECWIGEAQREIVL